MAAHSSILAWRIPWIEEPGGLQSTGLQRVGHDWATTLTYRRKQRGIKEPLDEGERGEWKSWLKAQHSKHEDRGIWSHHFMANRRGETTETVSNFILGGSKTTADGDCNYEIKRCLLLGRKAMTNLDTILKSRDILVNKGPSSHIYGFFQ